MPEDGIEIAAPDVHSPMTEFATTAGSAARAVRRFARSRRMPPGVLANPVRQRSKDQPVASVRLRWSGPNFNREEFAPDSPLEGGGFELPVPVRQAKLARSCR